MRWRSLRGGVEKLVFTPEPDDDIENIAIKGARAQLREERLGYAKRAEFNFDILDSLWGFIRKRLGEWKRGDIPKEERVFNNKGSSVDGQIISFFCHSICSTLCLLNLAGAIIFGNSASWLITGSVLTFFFPGIFLITNTCRYFRLRREFNSRSQEKARGSISQRKDLVVYCYKRSLEHQEMGVLGEDSAFGILLSRSRSNLKNAEEALKYWSSRLKGHGRGQKTSISRDEIEKKKEEARKLVERFGAVVEKLEHDKTIIANFIVELRSHLPVIESAVSDYYEMERLRKLKVEAGLLEQRAETIGMQILSEMACDLMRVRDAAAGYDELAHIESSLDMAQIEKIGSRLFKISKEQEGAEEKLLATGERS